MFDQRLSILSYHWGKPGARSSASNTWVHCCESSYKSRSVESNQESPFQSQSTCWYLILRIRSNDEHTLYKSFFSAFIYRCLESNHRSPWPHSVGSSPWARARPTHPPRLVGPRLPIMPIDVALFQKLKWAVRPSSVVRCTYLSVSGVGAPSMPAIAVRWVGLSDSWQWVKEDGYLQYKHDQSQKRTLVSIHLPDIARSIVILTALCKHSM